MSTTNIKSTGNIMGKESVKKKANSPKNDNSFEDKKEYQALPEAEIQTFRTKDLNQAAFIWCQPGANLVRLQGKAGKGVTVHFVFELPIEEDDLPKLIFDYTNRKTLVEPLEFCSRQNSLRDLLHSGLKRYTNGDNND